MTIVVVLKNSDNREVFNDASMEQDDWAVYISQHSKNTTRTCIFSKSEIKTIVRVERKEE